MAEMSGRAVAEKARVAVQGPVARPARPLEEVGRHGGGSPLPEFARQDFEARFGADFSRVRVHADAAAAGLAVSLNAAALTVGNDIFFASGHYSPRTSAGRKLLAHELAHTLQPAGEGLSTQGDAAERAAEQSAAAYEGGQTVHMPRHGAGLPGAIRRQPLTGATGPGTADPGTALIEGVSPLLASAIGSQNLDNFPTGQAEPTPDHLGQLKVLAATINILLRSYPLSTITIIGHADTVGEEASNVTLGQGRADAVAAALSQMDVPAIMTTESQGEGPSQAVPTGDKVSNARNRRVEIRFHPRKSPLGRMVPELLPPSKPGGVTFGGPIDQGGTKPIDLNYHPKPVPDDGSNLPRDYYKPLPPPIKGSGPKSFVDAVGEKIIDPVIDAVAGWLPKDKRDWLKEKARDGVEKGSTALARSAAESLGVSGDGLDAIEKAVEAAIKDKGGSGDRGEKWDQGDRWDQRGKTP